MFRYTGNEDDKPECKLEHVGNVADMICEYIEQEMKSEVCRPFKADDGTPCYKIEDCNHPNCPFKL